jgi:hypothetical protein
MRTFRTGFATYPPTPAEALERYLAEQRPTNDPRCVAERRARFAIECAGLRRDSGVPAEFAEASIIASAVDERMPPKYRGTAHALHGLLTGTARLVGVTGPRGTGKTGLISGLCNAFCDCHLEALYLPSTTALFEMVKGTFGQDGATERLWRRLRTAALLALDESHDRDVDKAWQDTRLTDLLNQRFLAGRKTVLGSNLRALPEPGDASGPPPFQRMLGESITRRLAQDGGIFTANWGRIHDLLERGGASPTSTVAVNPSSN